MKGNVAMLCGGVGGARAALALYENLPAENLTFIVNTGDDFTHLGLEIWPDWDTVVYHLGGLNDPVRGWGRADEGDRVMQELARLGAPCWFQLGDRDLGLHIYRNWARTKGEKRHEISRSVCARYGIRAKVLPVTEQSLETKLCTDQGVRLDFQEWFVELRCEPRVAEVVNAARNSATLTEGVAESLRRADFLVFAPSNPYLSIGPMLAHPELRRVIDSLEIPKIAVSPLIGGKAVKGPLDRLIESLSDYRGQEAVARYWGSAVDALLLPADECGEVAERPLPLLPCHTMLKSPEDRRRFCRDLVQIWKGL